MAINFRITGKKGNRKVLKSVDISEENYKAIKNLTECGPELAENTQLLSLQETYDIFGGNCYDMLVTTAIEQMISAIIHELEDKKYLSIDGEEAYYRLSNIIFPIMCYTSNGEEYVESLNFFNTNAFEICDVVKECLIEEKAEFFVNHLMQALNDDNRPAGEIAMAMLMYLANDSIEGIETENDNEVAN